MTFLTTEEKQQIADTIKQVEARTSGEFIAVIADASDSYQYIPLLWACLFALMLPGLLLILNLQMDSVYIYQFGLFAICAILFRWTPLKFWVVPKLVKHQRARRVAREQFLLQGLHHTEKRNGVLLFVSVAERYVELIADKGVNDVVEQGVWNQIVQQFVGKVKAKQIRQGFIDAIQQSGDVLQQHFPVQERDINELPNHLVEIGVPD
jgi:putative membrane protein